MVELMLWDEILHIVYSLVHKHNYMNNEPCVSGINPHFLHTEELARCRSENFLFSGFLVQIMQAPDSLPWRTTLSFLNTDLLEKSLPYIRIVNTYCKYFSISLLKEV